MRKNDILVIGELNADLILNNIQSFPKIGTEILSRDMTLTMGSSSAIFACNASSLGSRVSFLGKIGIDDFGNLVRNSLQEKNVKTDFIIQSSEYNTGVTIVLNYNEDRAMVTHPGAMEKLVLEDINLDKIKTAKHVHISSVFLQTGIKNHLKEIFTLAKDNGCTTSMDTQWDPEEKWDIDFNNILPFVDLFIPNEQEIMAITKTKDVTSAINSIKDFANNIVVKMGSKGSMGYVNGGFIKAEPYLNTNVIDAIGAGDSFDAGFVVKFLQGGSLGDCLHYGNLIGAINTTSAGGTSAFESMDIIKQTALTQFNVRI